MKKVLIAMLILVLSSSSNLVAANVNDNTKESLFIPAGTIIELELSTPVHSKRNKIGDMIILKVREDVFVDGIMVVQKGSTGLAYVTDVKRAGPWGKGGAIKLKAECVWSINEIKIPIDFDLDEKGSGHKMLVPIILVGLYSGYITGEHVSIQPGTKFSAQVPVDTNLNCSSSDLTELSNKQLVH